MYYCVDCKYFSTKVKGKKNNMYDGFCVKNKKNIIETDRNCKDFVEEMF